jgi:hypothetical protein
MLSQPFEKSTDKSLKSPHHPTCLVALLVLMSSAGIFTRFFVASGNKLGGFVFCLFVLVLGPLARDYLTGTDAIRLSMDLMVSLG